MLGNLTEGKNASIIKFHFAITQISQENWPINCIV